jgi:DNA-binding LacI/PurR family transcriptional regulator
VASILDISRITGISKSTVQRVLSGTGSFSEDVAERVRAAARELGYRPNSLARAMKTKRTHVIGVIVYRKHMPIISHPFYGPVLDSIASELKKHGYGILLIPDSDINADSGDWLMEHQVDGMVLISYITESLIRYFRDLAIPFVLINNSEMVDDVSYVVNDDYQGAYDATSYLVEQGYRKIAFVAGPTLHRSYRLRLQGYQDALAKHGRKLGDQALEEPGLSHSDRKDGDNKDSPTAAGPKDSGLIQSSEYVYSGDSVLETGSEAAAQFLALGDARPDAVLASNDMMAIGVLRAFYARGIRIPEDIAVMGFDDIEYARLATPALSTVRVDKASMGELAVQKLMTMLNHQENNPERIVLPSKLIIRESALRHHD